MSRKSIVVIVAIVLSLSAASMGAWAVQSKVESLGAGIFCDGPVKSHIMGRIGRLLTLRSDLNVTDKQKDEIKGIVKKNKNELLSRAKAVVEKRRALREAVLAKQPNPDQIKAAADALGKAVGEAAVTASKVIAEARPMLKADQEKTIKTFIESNDKALDKLMAQLGH